MDLGSTKVLRTELFLRVPQDTYERVETLANVWHQSVAATAATLVERGLRDAECLAVCRVCGCTEWDACVDEEAGETCGWAAEDLCTRCFSKQHGGSDAGADSQGARADRHRDG